MMRMYFISNPLLMMSSYNVMPCQTSLAISLKYIVNIINPVIIIELSSKLLLADRIVLSFFFKLKLFLNVKQISFQLKYKHTYKP